MMVLLSSKKPCLSAKKKILKTLAAIRTPVSQHVTSNIANWYDMIYLLTATGLTPGEGSTVHIYTQTTHRTTQLTRTTQIKTRTTQLTT